MNWPRCAIGTWAQTGEGIIDFEGTTNFLVDTDYDGWIVMEDEADAAVTDPDGVTLNDGVYIQNELKSLISHALD